MIKGLKLLTLLYVLTAQSFAGFWNDDEVKIFHNMRTVPYQPQKWYEKLGSGINNFGRWFANPGDKNYTSDQGINDLKQFAVDGIFKKVPLIGGFLKISFQTVGNVISGLGEAIGGKKATMTPASYILEKLKDGNRIVNGKVTASAFEAVGELLAREGITGNAALIEMQNITKEMQIRGLSFDNAAIGQSIAKGMMRTIMETNPNATQQQFKDKTTDTIWMSLGNSVFDGDVKAYNKFLAEQKKTIESDFRHLNRRRAAAAA